MSGHSKWSQIKHKKALTDAKRGKLFSKLVREITVAAKTGGAKPESNPRLKSAMEQAKSLGLPKDNIERALQKAAGKGEDSQNLQEFIYEALGSGGISIIVEGITDNKNRTLAQIKQILAEHGGKLADQGSLLWGFDKILTDDGYDYRPKFPYALESDDKEKLDKLLDALSEQDDVQEVYTNIKE